MKMAAGIGRFGKMGNIRMTVNRDSEKFNIVKKRIIGCTIEDAHHTSPDVFTIVLSGGLLLTIDSETLLEIDIVEFDENPTTIPEQPSWAVGVKMEQRLLYYVSESTVENIHRHRNWELVICFRNQRTLYLESDSRKPLKISIKGETNNSVIYLQESRSLESLSSDLLKREAEDILKFVEEKTIVNILQKKPTEWVIEFSNGISLFVEADGQYIEPSIT